MSYFIFYINDYYNCFRSKNYLYPTYNFLFFYSRVCLARFSKLNPLFFTKSKTFTLISRDDESKNFTKFSKFPLSSSKYLTFRKLDDKFDCGIYHKPTHTDIVICKYSIHPYSLKMDSFFCYIHRLLSVPMNEENFNEELDIIKQIADNNNDNPEIVDILGKRVKYKRALNMVHPLTARRNLAVRDIFHVNTYVGEISEKFAKYFRNFDENIAFEPEKNLQTLIRNS